MSLHLQHNKVFVVTVTMTVQLVVEPCGWWPTQQMMHIAVVTQLPVPYLILTRFMLGEKRKRKRCPEVDQSLEYSTVSIPLMIEIAPISWDYN